MNTKITTTDVKKKISEILSQDVSSLDKFLLRKLREVSALAEEEIQTETKTN